VNTHRPLPPRTHNLSPVDFYLYGYLKDKVKSRKLATLHEVGHEIEQPCAAILAEALLQVYDQFLPGAAMPRR
jgi:hypothetical protein